MWETKVEKIKYLHFNFVSPFQNKKNTVHKSDSSPSILSTPLSVWSKTLLVRGGCCKKCCCLMWLLMKWLQQHHQIIQMKWKLNGEKRKNRNNPEIYVPVLFTFISSFLFWGLGFSEKHWAVLVLFKLWLAKCSFTLWQCHPAYIFDWVGVEGLLFPAILYSGALCFEYANVYLWPSPLSSQCQNTGFQFYFWILPCQYNK